MTRSWWWLWTSGAGTTAAITPVDPPPVGTITIAGRRLKWNGLFVRIDTAPADARALAWTGEHLVWAGERLEWAA